MTPPMTRALQVSAGEFGLIRVFALNLDPAEIAALLWSGPPPGAAFTDTTPPNPKKADPMPFDARAALLGLDWLDDDFTEVIRLIDLQDIGLAGYLVEGNDVAEAEVAADLNRMIRLKGYVFLVFSAAFGGRAHDLHPAPGVELIGVYAQTDAPPAALWAPHAPGPETIRPGLRIAPPPPAPPAETRVQTDRSAPVQPQPATAKAPHPSRPPAPSSAPARAGVFAAVSLLVGAGIVLSFILWWSA